MGIANYCNDGEGILSFHLGFQKIFAADFESQLGESQESREPGRHID